ncbi:agmatinase [Meridianimarinicoccus aquatilis]|uniref:Agmatinase n=1 Tax=Meridianimarinicoccus aquatilis TaxID=2552766 RepID=A0A4R6B400_9RHOB|nr:agmatinase [Fluviibacterium aquatile]TDL89413.1 agmatinase [Fluviibacterium aquatile]
MVPFLDGELSAAETDPAQARFRVIPVPLERTVSYGAGTANGPAALLEASVELERLWRGGEPCAQGIVTEDPVDCSGELPSVMERIAARTTAAVSAGCIPVVLGGEHSLSYGAVRGVAAALKGTVGIVQIDAHADLRRAYQQERHSHASVMQLLGEEDGIALAQFGVRALCTQEAELRSALNVFHVDAEELVTRGLHAVELPADFPKQVYVSFDVDGLDPSVMPATGTPVPGGLGFWQAIHLVQSALNGRQLVGCDVVELAPRPGDAVSDFTAAQVTYALMALA